MDVNAITQLVSSLGFPIIACGAVMWFVYKFINKITDESQSRETKLMEHMEKQNDVLKDISATLETMNTRLDNLESKVAVSK